MKEIYKDYNDLPLTMSAPMVADVLGISRNCAYELFRRKDFPTICIGKRKIVAKAQLIQWIETSHQQAERGA